MINYIFGTTISLIFLNFVEQIYSKIFGEKFVQQNSNIKKILNKEDIKIMYWIIIKKGSIDKDKYCRKISNQVAKNFCKIAIKNNIPISLEITDSEFDFIYEKYVELQINKHT